MLTRAGAIALAAILAVLVAACGGSGASPERRERIHRDQGRVGEARCGRRA